MGGVAVGSEAQRVIRIVDISVLAVSTILKAEVSGSLVVLEYVL
jgi:hypothetical protein